MSVTLLLMALVAGQDGTVGPGPKDQSLAPQIRDRKLDTILLWNELALESIRSERIPPPRASRLLALLHVAMADAVNPIYQRHRPYRVALRATENIDPTIAAASAAHRVLTQLVSRRKKIFDREYENAIAAVEEGRPRELGVKLGKYVADRLLTARRDDGSNRVGEYRVTLDIGIWRPTLPKHAAGLLPHWGDVAPFGIKDRKSFRVEDPPALNSDQYTREFDEVKAIGSRRSRTRSAEQSIIAWFWDDGPGTCTPAGHWNLIAQEVSLTRKLTLPENARLFALLNIALADAAVVCWECKYRHRLWRPITAIRGADNDGNPDTEADDKWEPLLDTPPFPSYTSGHSTFSGAGATMLAKFFETDRIEFTIRSDGFPGTQRTYGGFWAAAHEAGRSRIYGGIHYECDNVQGLALGKAVAEEIYRTRLILDETTSRLLRARSVIVSPATLQRKAP